MLRKDERMLVIGLNPGVALSQGWMATVLNIIMTGVTVFMVVDEEEVFESANKQWASSSLLLRGYSPHSYPH